jgi:hypothetical protein
MLVAVIGIALFVITSGGNSIDHKSPSEVVVAAYMAANEGKYSEVEKYMSSDAISAIKNLGALAGGMKGIWDKTTHSGTIRKIEIPKQEVRGEEATVYFRILFKDGKTEDGDEPLIKEGGQWKITIS